jgi:hypothetical protein
MATMRGKIVAHQPAGAACRQVDRRRSKRQRIAGNGKAELAAGQSLDQRRQKRRRCRYGENTRGHIADLFASSPSFPRKRESIIAIRAILLDLWLWVPAFAATTKER